jgi:hypothetical protein
MRVSTVAVYSMRDRFSLADTQHRVRRHDDLFLPLRS